jgi:pimeloyl-ACP methyl ester carboxylesterase
MSISGMDLTAMLRLIINVIVAIIVVYVGLCVALFCFQRSLIYFPQKRAFGSSDTVATLHVPGAELRLSVRARRGTTALLYFGGNAEDVSASLPDLSGVFPDHAIYLLHYRGYGGSSGKPSEQVLCADALALFDKVHTEHPNVIVVGRSLGSGLAVRLASVRPVSRLVLITPYDSLQALAVQQFPYLPVRWMLLDKFESWRYAPQVSAPTEILVAERDEVIPMANSKQLYSRFVEGVASYNVIPGVSHNSISESPEYLRTLKGVL